jgi:hypothetical protein
MMATASLANAEVCSIGGSNDSATPYVKNNKDGSITINNKFYWPVSDTNHDERGIRNSTEWITKFKGDGGQTISVLFSSGSQRAIEEVKFGRLIYSCH